MTETSESKWDRIYAATSRQAASPTWFLPWLPSLSVGCTALDVACGLGGASLVLAQHGFSVVATDISQVALDSLVRVAEERQQKIHCMKTDLEAPNVWERLCTQSSHFSVIHCAHYLDYALFAQLVTRLAPGGRLITEHHGAQNIERNAHPSARYLVDPERLESALGELTVLFREDGWKDNRYLCRRVWTTAETP